LSVAELLEGKRICVCAGSGGVGKTTTSAAIALGMAAQGAKVAVVTIDPAKRLANALGVEKLQNDPRRVAPERLSTGGLEVRGELWAMMLDPKRTFDELIERIAPDPARAEEIKANRVYAELSTAIAGSQEFTAIAKLYDLDQQHDFDLVVLDTPPSRNALEFLEAPRRLSSFFEGGALHALVRPTGMGMRVLGRGTTPLFGALRRVTGVDLVSDLGTFFQLLGDMTSDFSARAAQVEQLLRAPTTAFLLVTSAEREPIDEAIWFHRTLQDGGLPFAGVVVNRVQDARIRRLPFQQKIGAGLTTEQFQKKVDDGSVRHVGMTESIAMIADSLGWTLDRIADDIQPKLASVTISSEYLAVDPGYVCGIIQDGIGYRKGEPVIKLHMEAYLGSPETYDSVDIEGLPSLSMRIAGGIHGDVATASIIVNSIPKVLSAAPGLHTMRDLPLPSFFSGR